MKIFETALNPNIRVPTVQAARLKKTETTFIILLSLVLARQSIYNLSGYENYKKKCYFEQLKHLKRLE
jgi:hypothetical protein